jgi:hypothetical protein
MGYEDQTPDYLTGDPDVPVCSVTVFMSTFSDSVTRKLAPGDEIGLYYNILYNNTQSFPTWSLSGLRFEILYLGF